MCFFKILSFLASKRYKRFLKMRNFCLFLLYQKPQGINKERKLLALLNVLDLYRFRSFNNRVSNK